MRRTGGGPRMEDDLNDAEARVVSLIGKVAVNGIEGGFDASDKLLSKAAHSSTTALSGW